MRLSLIALVCAPSLALAATQPSLPARISKKELERRISGHVAEQFPGAKIQRILRGPTIKDQVGEYRRFKKPKLVTTVQTLAVVEMATSKGTQVKSLSLDHRGHNEVVPGTIRDSAHYAIPGTFDGAKMKLIDRRVDPIDVIGLTSDGKAVIMAAGDRTKPRDRYVVSFGGAKNDILSHDKGVLPASEQPRAPLSKATRDLIRQLWKDTPAAR
jgi:hypothetical protein